MLTYYSVIYIEQVKVIFLKQALYYQYLQSEEKTIYKITKKFVCTIFQGGNVLRGSEWSSGQWRVGSDGDGVGSVGVEVLQGVVLGVTDRQTDNKSVTCNIFIHQT